MQEEIIECFSFFGVPLPRGRQNCFDFSEYLTIIDYDEDLCLVYLRSVAYSIDNPDSSNLFPRLYLHLLPFLNGKKKEKNTPNSFN